MSLLTLDQFKESCDPLTFQVIGRKVTAIHPHFLMVPTEKEINVAKEGILSIANDVDISVHCVIFAIAVYRFGMSEVLCCRDIVVDGLGHVFKCFTDPKSRLEIAKYFATQMLSFREDLRYQPNYVDILMKSATKSTKVIEILSLNVYGGKDIMLFCGLSVYTLLMACTPSEVFEDEKNCQIITKCQLEWRMQRNVDLGAFLRQASCKTVDLQHCDGFMAPITDFSHIFMDDDAAVVGDVWDYITGKPQPIQESSRLLLVTETIMDIPAPRIDAWGNAGDDCMERIALLLDAAAECSPSLGVLGQSMPIIM